MTTTLLDTLHTTLRGSSAMQGVHPLLTKSKGHSPFGVATPGMEGLAATVFPLTLTGSGPSYVFASDASYGVRLDQILSPTAFAWNTDLVIAGQSAAELWSLGCRQVKQLSGKNVLSSVAVETSYTPDNAASFEAYNISAFVPDTEAHMFLWRGVGHASFSDTFWVSVVVAVDAARAELNITGAFGKEKGDTLCVDNFRLPKLSIEVPNPPRGAETIDDAIRRTRILVPCSAEFVTPLSLGSNTPLSAWIDYSLATNHPAPLQSLQFFAIAGMDAADAASFRQVLMCWSKDVPGWAKEFRYGRAKNATDCSFIASHSFIPGYAKELAQSNDHYDDLPPESWIKQSYSSPYKVSLLPLVAAADSFWVDVCDVYRDWREAAQPMTPRGSGSRSQLGEGNSIMLTYASRQVSYHNDENSGIMHSQAYDYVADLRAKMASVLEAQDDVFVECQSPLKFGFAPFENASDIEPPGIPPPGFSSGYLEAVKKFLADGVKLSVYNRPTDMAAGAEPSPDFVFQYLRVPKPADTAGLEDVALNPGGTLARDQTHFALDIAVPEYWQWYKDVALKSSMSNGITGAYLDTLGGVYLSYPRKGDSETQRPHVARGGRYGSDAVRALIEVARSRGDHVLTEIFDEVKVGISDWDQLDYSWRNNQMHWAEKTLVSAAEALYGITIASAMNEANYPLACREISPPLIQLVYNRYHPACRLLMPLTPALWSGSKMHPGPLASPGLNTTEVADCHHFVRYSGLHSGVASMFDYYCSDLAEILSTDTGWGNNIWNMVKNCHQVRNRARWFDFLVSGYLARTPEVDETTATVRTNPYNAILLKANLVGRTPNNDFAPGQTDVLPYMVPSFTNSSNVYELQAFDVYGIQVSAWQNAARDKVCILVSNWTVAGTDQLTFTYDPAHYKGVTGNATLYTPFGTPTALGPVAAPTTFGVNGAAGAIAVSVPARSLRVIVIE